jgi:hypothetical protein
MLQTDCVDKSKPTKQSWEGGGCRASHPLLTAKDGAPSVVLGYRGTKGGPPARGAVIVRLVILLLVSSFNASGQSTTGGVQAEMAAQKPLSLRFNVTSAAPSRITLLRYLLPWGNVNSIVLLAVTGHGEVLQRDMPIDDPSNQKISLDPGESVSGAIDLRKAFRGLDSTLQKDDVNLFWAYHAPNELGISARWGGWILLRRRH